MNFLENFFKEETLNGLEPLFGRFDQAGGASPLLNPTIMIVAQGGGLSFCSNAALVSKPTEFINRQVQSRGEFANGQDRKDGPGRWRTRGGMHLPRPMDGCVDPEVFFCAKTLEPGIALNKASDLRCARAAVGAEFGQETANQRMNRAWRSGDDFQNSPRSTRLVEAS